MTPPLVARLTVRYRPGAGWFAYGVRADPSRYLGASMRQAWATLRRAFPGVDFSPPGSEDSTDTEYGFHVPLERANRFLGYNQPPVFLPPRDSHP